MQLAFAGGAIIYKCVCHFLAAAFSAAAAVLMSAVCLFAMDGIFVRRPANTHFVIDSFVNIPAGL